MLKMVEVSKAFAHVVANDRVTFEVGAGQIHGLLGENGSGKTTLMNILYGLYRPDSGTIHFKGQELVLSSPAVAIEAGIGMVHQHYMLIPTMSVVENVLLGLGTGWLKIRETSSRIKQISESYGLSVDPAEQVDRLSLGLQQRVEIIKALLRGADLLILDEPTAMLTPGEAKELFAVLRRLRESGKSVIFITHKMQEVMQICDSITVMRAGKVVGTRAVESTSTSELTEMMVGQKTSPKLARTTMPRSHPVLEVSGVHVRDSENRERVNNVSFTVRAGEILGIGGVDGNGQSELAAVIGGLMPAAEGSISLNGVDVTDRGARDRLSLGLSYIPADRMGTAVVLDFSISENIVLRDFRRAPFSSGGFLSPDAIAEQADRLRAQFGISVPRDTRVRDLSGGNQQRVILARELAREPICILAEQPTRGLDVNATNYVLNTLLAMRSEGAAIVYISTELEELTTISDRIAVLFKGQFVDIRPTEEMSVEDIGMMMAGVRPSAATA